MALALAELINLRNKKTFQLKTGKTNHKRGKGKKGKTERRKKGKRGGGGSTYKNAKIK